MEVKQDLIYIVFMAFERNHMPNMTKALEKERRAISHV